MLNLSRRLTAIEKAMGQVHGGRCPLCHGYPVATVFVVNEPNPDGPGFRETGVRVLNELNVDRVTDGLQCRECGRDACVIRVRCPGHFQPPAGKVLQRVA